MDVSLQIGQLRQDVLVTATATAIPASQVGASVTVIDRDTLDALAKPDVLEALRLVPGTNVVQIGARGGITSLFVRGGNVEFQQGADRWCAPLTTSAGASISPTSRRPAWSASRCCATPNSVLYGTDALASVD